jgi:hypothetical protein
LAFSKKHPLRISAGRVPSPSRGRPSVGPIIFLALGALLFCLWAIERHYSFRPRPMLVPAAKPVPTYDADAGEIPAPELTR